MFCLLLCGADLSLSSLRGELRVGGKINHTERSCCQSEVTLNTARRASSEGEKNATERKHTEKWLKYQYELHSKRQLSFFSSSQQKALEDGGRETVQAYVYAGPPPVEQTPMYPRNRPEVTSRRAPGERNTLTALVQNISNLGLSSFMFSTGFGAGNWRPCQPFFKRRIDHVQQTGFCTTAGNRKSSISMNTDSEAAKRMARKWKLYKRGVEESQEGG